MAHRDAVIDRDRVEFLGDAARRLDFSRDQLAKVLQMDVTRHELREGIGDRDDRLAEVAVFHAGRAPKPARARHIAAVGGGAGAIGGHGGDLGSDDTKGTLSRKLGGMGQGSGQNAYRATGRFDEATYVTILKLRGVNGSGASLS